MSLTSDAGRTGRGAAVAAWLLVALLAVVALVGAAVALLWPFTCGSAADCDEGRVELGSAVGLAPLAVTLVVGSLVRSRHRAGRPARTPPAVGLAVTAALLSASVLIIESGIAG